VSFSFSFSFSFFPPRLFVAWRTHSHHIFESKKKIYLVTELLEGGELFDLIVERGHFSETDASKLIRKVVEALAYLHSKNIVHRDLKPENLLFSSSDNLDSVRVTDFGLSKIANQKLKTACGTVRSHVSSNLCAAFVCVYLFTFSWYVKSTARLCGA